MSKVPKLTTPISKEILNYFLVSVELVVVVGTGVVLPKLYILATILFSRPVVPSCILIVLMLINLDRFSVLYKNFIMPAKFPFTENSIVISR